MTEDQKQKAKLRQKRYWSKNREKLAEKKRRHYYKYREKYLLIERDRSYRKLYGITLEDYNNLLVSQKGKCAICGTTEVVKGTKTINFSVDHNHTTGKVRGLLCTGCNRLLGRYEKYKVEINNYLERDI